MDASYLAQLSQRTELHKDTTNAGSAREFAWSVGVQIEGLACQRDNLAIGAASLVAKEQGCTKNLRVYYPVSAA